MRSLVAITAPLLVALATIGSARTAMAQDYEPPPPTAPPPPPQRFVVPDMEDSWMNWSRYDGKRFSTRLSLVPIVDYTAFAQDDDSVDQVGEQDSQWDLRTFRIMVRGQFKFRHPIEYFASLEVKGRDHVSGPEDRKTGWTDLYLATTLPRVGKILVGKIKEPWVYEMVGDAANLQQEERALNPFFVSRGIGVRVQNTMAGQRMSWAAGWFNDWWIEGEPFNGSGNQFSARLTGLPVWSADGSRYVHLGLSARYTGANDGTLRFRGRPESNVSSYYVDSGDLTADRANELGLEAIAGSGPFFFTSEYVRANVDAQAAGDPAFWGTYVTASYVLTGEHRPYDRAVAYARRIMPKGRWGAWEVVMRYSHVDIDDAEVRGGIFDRGTVGLTWWATRHWRLSIDYGLIDLDRSGKHGITQTVHPRFQWVY